MNLIKKVTGFRLQVAAVFALIVLATTYTLLPTTSFSQESQLGMTFSPSRANLKVEEEKIVKVTLGSSNRISAFDLNFKTDGGLKISDFEDTIGTDNNYNPFNLTRVIKNISGSSSRISYIFNSPSQDLPSRVEVYLKVKGSAVGNSNLILDYNNSQALDSSGQLFRIDPVQASYSLNINQSDPAFINPADLPQPNYPASTAVVNLKLKLRGAENLATSEAVKAIAVAVGRVGDQIYETQSREFYLRKNSDNTFSGTVAFADFKDGTKFSLMIKVDKYLLRRICDINPKEGREGAYNCNNPGLTIRSGQNNFDFSGISLLPGDLGLIDGIVNGYDLSIIRNNLNKNTRETASVADINYDGVIDAKDFDLVKQTILLRGFADQ